MTVVRGQLPDFAALGIEWPAPLDAVAEYESLRDRYGATAAAVDRLLREREAVRLQDREALGAALRAGKRDPGASLVAEHEAKIVAAERQHEALGIAVNAAYADLVARVEQYRAEWSAEVGEQLAHDRQDLAVAVHRWAETRRRLHEHRALASWVASFPATKGFKVPAPPITGLVARNLEPMPAADVLRRSPPRWRRERAGSARTGTAAILTGRDPCILRATRVCAAYFEHPDSPREAV